MQIQCLKIIARLKETDKDRWQRDRLYRLCFLIWKGKLHHITVSHCSWSLRWRQFLVSPRVPLRDFTGFHIRAFLKIGFGIPTVRNQTNEAVYSRGLFLNFGGRYNINNNIASNKLKSRRNQTWFMVFTVARQSEWFINIFVQLGSVQQVRLPGFSYISSPTTSTKHSLPKCSP